MNINTMREFLEAVTNDTENEVLANYAKEEIKKLDLRNEKRRSQQTETQKENEILKKSILEHLMLGEQYLIADLAKDFGLSPQKTSALLRQLEAEDEVSSYDVRIDTDGYIKEVEATTGRPRKAYMVNG